MIRIREFVTMDMPPNPTVLSPTAPVWLPSYERDAANWDSLTLNISNGNLHVTSAVDELLNDPVPVPILDIIRFLAYLIKHLSGLCIMQQEDLDTVRALYKHLPGKADGFDDHAAIIEHEKELEATFEILEEVKACMDELNSSVVGEGEGEVEVKGKVDGEVEGEVEGEDEDVPGEDASGKYTPVGWAFDQTATTGWVHNDESGLWNYVEGEHGGTWVPTFNDETAREGFTFDDASQEWSYNKDVSGAWVRLVYDESASIGWMYNGQLDQWELAEGVLGLWVLPKDVSRPVQIITHEGSDTQGNDSGDENAF